MRSAATTGNRFIMIHCDGNHDGDDYDNGGGDNRHDDTYSDNHDVMMMAMEMTTLRRPDAWYINDHFVKNKKHKRSFVAGWYGSPATDPRFATEYCKFSSTIMILDL